MSSKYYIGDCEELIKELSGNSVDMIYTNFPFATTANTWDKNINFKELFPEMYRVTKPTGNIVLHAAIPFTYRLIEIERPSYNWVWEKGRPTGHLNAKKEPLRNLEEILIYKTTPAAKYNPQMRGSQLYKSKRTNPAGSNYLQKQKSYESEHRGKYPTTFLGKYSYVSQKQTPKSIPRELTIEMLRTYSDVGDTILDLTCCSRENGDIAIELERNYIGIDISDEFLK